MSDGEAEQDRDDDQQLVDLALLLLPELGVALHLGLREGAIAASTAASPCSGVDALGELGDDEEVAGRRPAGDLLERVERDEPAAEPSDVSAKIPATGRSSSVPFWNVIDTCRRPPGRDPRPGPR